MKKFCLSTEIRKFEEERILRIGKDYLISALADAYREASGKTERVKACELARCISSLEYTANTKGYILCDFNSDGYAEKLISRGIGQFPRYAFSGRDSEDYLYLKEISIDVPPSDIPAYFCNGCSSLLSVDDIIKNAESIGSRAFAGCTSLAEVTFTANPGLSMTSPFYGCTGILTIRVPWSEGDVTGAPWGATNAEIIYDYTGENDDG